MKKFTSLFLLSATLLSAPAHAEITGYIEKSAKPAHTELSVTGKVNTTTPNLMSSAVKHSKDLALSEKQKAAILIWRESHARHMRVLMHKTAVLEKASVKQALKGEKKSEILAKIDQSNALRKEIASNKMDCRDNLRKILNESQWKQLVSLYKKDQKAKATSRKEARS